MSQVNAKISAKDLKDARLCIASIHATLIDEDNEIATTIQELIDDYNGLYNPILNAWYGNKS